jgi:hypothetical protein
MYAISSPVLSQHVAAEPIGPNWTDLTGGTLLEVAFWGPDCLVDFKCERASPKNQLSRWILGRLRLQFRVPVPFDGSDKTFFEIPSWLVAEVLLGS